MKSIRQHDTINGGAGRDLIIGGYGGDHIHGGADSDFLIGDEADNVTFGVDAIVGGGGDDSIYGGGGDDTLSGGAGSDWFIGFNPFYHGEQAAPATVDLGLQGVAQDTGAGLDVLTGFENLWGTYLNDRLIGDGGANILNGGSGDDILKGAGGDDTLIGSTGFDLLNGGEGDDCIHGDAASIEFNEVTLLGGGGDDVIYFAILGGNVIDGGEGEDWVTFFDTRFFGSPEQPIPEKAALADIGAGLENIAGGRWNDRLTGDDGANKIAGDWGDDRLSGGRGGDLLLGDGFVNGDGSVNQSGRANPSFGSYNDTLIGGGGSDTLIGALGSDRLRGGGGADTFVFLESHDAPFTTRDGDITSTDIIADLSDADIIDLGAIDPNGDPSDGDQPLDLVSGFSGRAGQLVVWFNGADTWFLADLDGDHAPNLAILALGDHRGFDNFVL